VLDFLQHRWVAGDPALSHHPCWCWVAVAQKAATAVAAAALVLALLPTDGLGILVLASPPASGCPAATVCLC
jgi:hypothetical protein